MKVGGTNQNGKKLLKAGIQNAVKNTLQASTSRKDRQPEVLQEVTRCKPAFTLYTIPATPAHFPKATTRIPF